MSNMENAVEPPKRSRKTHNGIVQPLLTDLYQITMAYAYWKSGKMNDVAVFDLFFRQNPFQGEFTIFAGLEECLRFLENFHYSDSDIEYLKATLPKSTEEEFYVFLQSLTTDSVTLYAIEEGSVVFPRVPLIRVEGPLIIVQLLETTFLTLVNFASLMATNAARYRLAAGRRIKLLEFGLRRAQGPDGGLSASKYAYIGGFDGTSNVLAGKMFNIPVKGTHAHAYITSFNNLTELQVKLAERRFLNIYDIVMNEQMLLNRLTGQEENLLDRCIEWRDKILPVLNFSSNEASDGELAALVSYAIAFPDGFMALVDTYDVKRSGLINFCAVALALSDLGYRAIGIRIDSGDLAYLSNKAHEVFQKVANQFNIPWFSELEIVASNDINEETILSLNEQNHKIDCFGIGTHLALLLVSIVRSVALSAGQLLKLIDKATDNGDKRDMERFYWWKRVVAMDKGVTCQRQPALGCVYKLVEINGTPRIKLSHDVAKVTMPGCKSAYRLYGVEGHALIDLLQRSDEDPPEVGHRVLCRHPFEESKRVHVTPRRVEHLHKCYWKDGKTQCELPTLDQVRQRVQTSLLTLRQDHKRNLNPTPYKVSVSDCLYNFIHDLWLQNAPIGELS